MLQSEIILTCFWMTVLLRFNLSATHVIAAVIFLNFPKRTGHKQGIYLPKRGPEVFIRCPRKLIKEKPVYKNSVKSLIKCLQRLAELFM